MILLGGCESRALPYVIPGWSYAGFSDFFGAPLRHFFDQVSPLVAPRYKYMVHTAFSCDFDINIDATAIKTSLPIST